MNRRLVLIAALMALLSARRAAAQTAAMPSDVSIGYQGLPYKSSGESNTGINIAEGMLLHLGAGVEAGYDSNVFYSNSSDFGGVISSGIIRTTAFGELSNSTRDPSVAAPSVVYSVRAGLSYRLYTSDNPNVEKYRSAFSPTAGLGLGTNSGHWSFQLNDSFIRLEDAPYLGVTIGSSPITRDSNLASVQAQWSPGGGRIAAMLRYVNTIDVFEQDSGFSYASSLSNSLVLDLSWKWLPKTALFLEASQGWITYLNDSTPVVVNGATTNMDTRKSSSYPLRIYVGLRGLITQRITAAVALGYVDAFYSSGASNSGILGSTYVDAQASYSPSMLNRLTVGFHQDIVNSVISNFYYETAFYASYLQQLAGRLALDLSGRLSHRTYEDLLYDPTSSRVDNTITVGATLDYFIRNWAYAGVGYSLLANLSDYHLPAAPGGPAGASVDYTKNQVFARLGITY